MFNLNEEQRMIRDTVRDFAINEVLPRADELDKTGAFPQVRQGLQENPYRRKRRRQCGLPHGSYHSLRCIDAPEKVFPHNLRHLFACVYYEEEKDISHLADLLGHASVNTTRIYLSRSSEEQAKEIDKMRLVL